MVYAGIGNRKIPDEAFSFLEKVGIFLSQKGYFLRSGNAAGADTAFQVGSRGNNQFFVWKDATPAAIELASRFHPAWHMCSDHAKALHGRNSMIILGKDLNEPVDFIACYAVDEENGGTALGIRLARAHGIPVFNLYKPEDYTKLLNHIEKA